MTIEFALADAHAAYCEKIEAIVTGLAQRYPWVPLRRVKLFEPRGNDQSLGNADEPGQISLSARWFAAEPNLLQEAALHKAEVAIGAGRVMAWHGAMLQEPAHLLTHEFGHVASQALPAYRDWSDTEWRRGTSDPDAAPSGYSLTNADEFFAECFAEFALGLAPPDRARAIADLIRSR